MRIVFNDPTEKGRRKPSGHLADVEVLFDAAEGPLAGLKLVGLAVWSHGDSGISVTLPSRKVEGAGKGKDWFFEYLRADDSPDAAERIKRFKDHVVEAFQAQTAALTGHA